MACERVGAFVVPLPSGSSRQAAAAPAVRLEAAAFTTVSGRIVEDPKGELQKVRACIIKDSSTVVRRRVSHPLNATPPPSPPPMQVLTPSPKDEARRARVGKLLEQVGLQYTGEALFPSNRYYKMAAFRDFCEGVGVEPADQVGAAALIVAAGDKGYKPFHKKARDWRD